MKKSKIIVPALAVLCLSTAAAVSGTVAWFTAARETEITVNSTVINPEGDLDVTLANINGTKVVGEKAISMLDNSALRDASVDIFSTPGSAKGVRAILDNYGNASSFKSVAGDETIEAKSGTTTYTVFYYVEWTVTFNLKNKLESDKYDIFFNETGSSLKAAGDHTGINAAYRVGMFTAEHQAVWAPTHGAEKLEYATASSVGSYTDETDVSTYDLSNTGSYTAVKGKMDNSSKSDAQESDLYLGECKGGNTGLTVHFVAWYEGLDEACNKTNLPSLLTNVAQYTMAFNAIAQTDYVAD